MSLFEYKCDSCGLKFEELKSPRENADVIPCRSCGGKALKQISPFAHSVAGGTTNEPVDMKIGREANKRWQRYHDNQSKRHGNAELKEISLPKAPDGKYMPVMGLGDKKQKESRGEYVSALQEHRKQRQEKGIGQFSGQGAF